MPSKPSGKPPGKPPGKSVRLGVNVDHAATLRNARGGAHPDPARAAIAAIAGGADQITAHLREDRRHIRDADIPRLRALAAPLNMEMAPREEILVIALKHKPHACMFVPEKREEITTESGLALAGLEEKLTPMLRALKDEGIRTSLFLDANPEDMALAARLGADAVELHTGPFCLAVADGEQEKARSAFKRVEAAAAAAAAQGLEVHAGHGLDYQTAAKIAAIEPVCELNIGHFLIGEALASGLEAAVHKMCGVLAAA